MATSTAGLSRAKFSVPLSKRQFHVPVPSELRTTQQAAERLCLDCGLCCNGVLFDQVVLQPADQIAALSARGLKIKKRQFFHQPCTALCGSLCQIYAHRPTRCRVFECRQFQQVATGGLSEHEARERIAEVRAAVAGIERLLTSSDLDNPRKSLAQRAATVQAHVQDEALATELEAQMTSLRSLLAEHFRV